MVLLEVRYKMGKSYAIDRAFRATLAKVVGVPAIGAVQIDINTGFVQFEFPSIEAAQQARFKLLGEDFAKPMHLFVDIHETV